MPTYNIGGKKIKTEQPLSDAQIDEIAKDLGISAKQESMPAFGGMDEYGVENNVEAGQPTGFARGLEDPVVALMQMLGGEELRKRLSQREQEYQKQREAAGETGIEWSRVGGNVLNPLNIIPGAAAAKGAAVLGGGRLAQAAAAGGVGALTQPLEQAETGLGDFVAGKAKQVATGAATGLVFQSALNVGGKVANFLNELRKPMTKAGRDSILRSKLQEFSGPDQKKIIDALENAEEIVPGSKPTAAQALADVPEATQLAAFEQKLSKSQGISPQFAARQAEQQTARETALREFAGDEKALQSAITARAADADRNYGAAFSETIKANPELLRISGNPYFRDAIPDAVKLAEAKGISSKTNLTEFLQNIKISLDKQLKKTGDTALADAEKREVAKVKGELLRWLEGKNPKFEEARKAFEEASKPINQMQVGQYLLDRLRSPLDQERAGQFALAVKDAAKTIQKAAGGPRYEKLSQVLTKEQEAAVNNVLADLQRAAKATELGKKSSLGTLNVDDSPELPQLLSRTAAVTNALLRAIKSNANTDINRRAAELFADPKALATFLSAVPKSRSKAFVDALYPRLSQQNRDILNRTLAVEGAIAATKQPEGSLNIQMETGPGATQ